MHYEGTIIRPPSEADSILLQVTTGCSHNKCSFCGTYKKGGFRVKPEEIVMEDIAFASKHLQRQNRLFLCDGDALILPMKRLKKIFAEIGRQLPWVERTGVYGSAKTLKRKTPEQLRELKKAGLKIVYMGLESGDDQTLADINKDGSSKDMIEQGLKVKEAGMKLSITVLLGVAGKERSAIHARETGKVLSAIDPDYVGALTLMLIPGTPLDQKRRAGEFTLMDSKEMLRELRDMFESVELSNGLFFANHASNYLPIKAYLPRDKKETLRLIDEALNDQIPLRPETYRAL